MKSILGTLVAVVFCVGISLAADLSEVSVRYSRILRSFDLSEAVAEEGSIHDFSLSCTDSTVADTARYTLVFRVSPVDEVVADLGGFVIAFPEGFDLSRTEVGGLTDDHPEHVFQIESTVRSGNILTIGLVHADSAASANPDTSISFSLVIADVVNTTISGQYQLAGLVFDGSGDILAGPTLSAQFRILPGPIETLAVTPSADTTLAAGSVVTFFATGYDAYANAVLGLSVNWSLANGSAAIGIFNGSAFLARKVGTGRVQATLGEISATSGEISVVPGPVGRIDLLLNPQQVVGRPLLGTSTATIYDAYGNRRTAHNLATSPLDLAVPELAGVLRRHSLTVAVR